MGRFYWGDIEGRFWVGVQDSDDISNLINLTYISTYEWKCCDCGTNADINYDKYCSECYGSYEEHKRAIDADDNDADDADDNDADNADADKPIDMSEKLYYQKNIISYEIYKDEHYDELLKSLKDLEPTLTDRVMQEFANIEQDDKILDTFKNSFEKTELVFKEEVKNGLLDISSTNILARYILGTQVKYCLEKNDYCNIICEC
jgi:hypothetical protein